MVGKTDLESMLDESFFGASTEIGGFALDKGPEVSLALEPFWTSIFTSLALEGAVSTTFCPSSYLNKNPPTQLLLMLQSIQIQFSASFNSLVQFQKGWVGDIEQHIYYKKTDSSSGHQTKIMLDRGTQIKNRQ